MADIHTLKPARQKLRVYGTGRVAGNKHALLVMLNGHPTDDQLRYLDEVIKRAVVCMPEDLS